MVAEHTAQTTKPLGTEAPTSGKLARLGVIPQYTSFAYGKLADLYFSGKTYVPKGLQPQVNNIELFYVKHGKPLVSKVADGGQEVLLLLDGQVDKGIKKGYAAYQNAKENPKVKEANQKFADSRNGVNKKVKAGINFAQENGVQGYTHFAKQKTVQVIEGSLDFAKSLIVSSSNYANSVTSASIDQLKKVKDVVVKNLNGGAVFGVAQQQSQAVIDIASEKGQAARDTLVKQPLYKKAYDSSNNLLASAQETTVYKEASKRLYPVVAPIADPALEKIQPYYKNTVEYFKPVSAAA